MAARTRIVRLDLSPALYDPLEYAALEADVGVMDQIRHILVEWSRHNPMPEDVEANS